jgi:hypothetical protein
LNGHVQSAVQQLIEPEPMELDLHPQDLDACDNPSGRVNSSVRPPIGLVWIGGANMHDLARSILLIGLVFIIIGGLLSRFFYFKRIITVSEPAFVPPLGAATIPPHIKHSLLFKIPKSIRTSESGEVIIEYYQGLTYFIFEGMNTFLYEKLDVLPRSLPNNLRGLFSSTFISPKKSLSALETDFSTRLTSSKLAVAPDGWVTYKKGTKTPCRWRWSISCNELGVYDLVIELSEIFRKKFPNDLDTTTLIFQIQVRSPISLSLRTVTIFKYLLIIIGSVLSTIAAFVLALPSLQDYASKMLKPWLP